MIPPPPRYIRIARWGTPDQPIDGCGLWHCFKGLAKLRARNKWTRLHSYTLACHKFFAKMQNKSTARSGCVLAGTEHCYAALCPNTTKKTIMRCNKGLSSVTRNTQNLNNIRKKYVTENRYPRGKCRGGFFTQNNCCNYKYIVI